MGAVSDWIGHALTIAAMVAAMGVAWGKLKAEQKATDAKHDAREKAIQEKFTEFGNGMNNLIARIEDMPRLFVRIDVDAERQKRFEEKDARFVELITSIREELKDIRRSKQ